MFAGPDRPGHVTLAAEASMANPLFNPPPNLQPDRRTQDWLERQQREVVREADRIREIQREIDRQLPGKPIQLP